MMESAADMLRKKREEIELLGKPGFDAAAEAFTAVEAAIAAATEGVVHTSKHKKFTHHRMSRAERKVFRTLSRRKNRRRPTYSGR
jgi:hypothetical protein